MTSWLLDAIRAIISENLETDGADMDTFEQVSCRVCGDDVEGSLHAPECPILKLTNILRGQSKPADAPPSAQAPPEEER